MKHNKTYCGFEKKFETLNNQLVNYARYQTKIQQHFIQKYKVDDLMNDVIKMVRKFFNHNIY